MSRKHRHQDSGSPKTKAPRVLTLAAGLALSLVLFNVVLHVSNLAKAQQLRSRAAYIQQSLKLERINNEFIKALAIIAVRKQDAQIEDLLSRHGISYRVEGGGTTARSGEAP